MRIKKKYVKFAGGYVRFNNGIEINWSLDDWALPLNITVLEHLIFIRILCVSLIIEK